MSSHSVIDYFPITACVFFCLLNVTHIFLSSLFVCIELGCLYSGSWPLLFRVACLPSATSSSVITGKKKFVKASFLRVSLPALPYWSNLRIVGRQLLEIYDCCFSIVFAEGATRIWWTSSLQFPCHWWLSPWFPHVPVPPSQNSNEIDTSEPSMV